MSNHVYITKSAKFFPNSPISNDEMEDYLGLINDKASKSKRIILRNNGIKRRFYAIDKNGQHTHTNSQMTALAVRALFDNAAALKSIDLLSCGTSTPDQMMPSHGVMVHGWLPETNAIEVVSPSGVCCAGMHAFKYAYMSIKLGDAKMAVATGSERLSRVLRGDVFEEESKKMEALEGNGYVGFEKDFLRWMLSDGAGAFLLSNEKNENDISLRIEWLEGVSYAHEIKPCMYMASEKLEDGNIKSYMDYSPQEIIDGSILSIKQDVKLLGEYIVPLGFDKLKLIFEKRNMTVDQIDYFLPHMSSEFFRSKISEKLEENGMAIPQERWFTNLSSVGNVGAGSIYMMVEELMYSGKLQKGQTILLAVPESSRFSYMFGLLTVC
ncbi:MAG: 3-oxoacyl-(acyl-carrier-protein) synthase [Chitinophagaceae bacterium]|nr:3-oxoacyl-(acyl-carrier-protein) synthase [Chitinophagaceae bacterium]